MVRVSETQLNVLCRTRTSICGGSPTPPVYDATFDLRTGGALIRGMVYVAPLGMYQQAGLVVKFSGTSVTIPASIWVGRSIRCLTAASAHR